MSDQLNQSDYHFTQANACLKLAERHPSHCAMWAMYRRVGQAHGKVGAALLELERSEADLRMVEDAHRKRHGQDERDYWTRQQVSPNPTDYQAPASGALVQPTVGQTLLVEK